MNIWTKIISKINLHIFDKISLSFTNVHGVALDTTEVDYEVFGNINSEVRQDSSSILSTKFRFL